MPEPITIIGVSSGFLAILGHLARRNFGAAKEVVDVLLGLLLGLIALPVIVVCAIIVKLSSRGPAFFVQQRVGRDGQLFQMFKLRTMRLDAEAGTGAVWATKGDPRIIPACRWMRRTHLDELPQLWNVIRGEMSVIGPRPERLEILTDLEKVYPEVRRRLAVKPGITGLAQVRNGYDTTVDAYRQKLAADLEYIEKRRWSMELRILIGTMFRLNDKDSH